MPSFLIYAFFIIGFISYIIAAWKGIAPLPRSTWLIWFFVDWITVYWLYIINQWSDLAFIAAIGSTIVLPFALIKGKMKWSWTDTFCSAGTVLSLLVWILLGDMSAGVIIIQIGSFLGAMPTVIAAWVGKERGVYAWVTWSFWFSGSILMLFQLKSPTFETLIQPSQFALSFILVIIAMIYYDNSGRYLKKPFSPEGIKRFD